jgi:hypothetical protein
MSQLCGMSKIPSVFSGNCGSDGKIGGRE